MFAAWLPTGIALSLALVFVAAGINKLADRQGFSTRFDAWALLPRGYGRLLSLPLALIELAIGLALPLPACRSIAGFAAGVLLAIYTAAIVINLLRGHTDYDCGCRGLLRDARPGMPLVLRNCLLCALAVWVGIAPATLPRDTAGWLGVVALTVLCTLVTAGFELLLWREGSEADD